MVNKIIHALILVLLAAACTPIKPQFYAADNTLFQYMGRIDFSDSKTPRFWVAGAHVQAKFKGTTCVLNVNDEVKWGTTHNYLEVSIDGAEPRRIKLKVKENVIDLSEGLAEGEHTITIIKATEALQGYIEFVGLTCTKLLAPTALPTRKIEFFGDSITSGMGSELTPIPCDSAEWYDQHTVYYGYAATTARAIDAQYHLTSESGIGLIHNCCNKPYVMPRVYDKLNITDDSLTWNFNRYQPDVVSICLGQNDGIQDSTQFVSEYVAFIKTLRGHYPNAQFVCFSSPMANEKLRNALSKYLRAMVQYHHAQGETKVDYYVFNRSFNNGCGGHPDKEDQRQIAQEVTSFIRTKMNWYD
ncbi:MAG: acetyl xylan esterase [Cyclobacteriaceae bacterium]|nr:MAG: acetyl xylan esterase [Cyclobacteriaceae bacterium]